MVSFSLSKKTYPNLKNKNKFLKGLFHFFFQNLVLEIFIKTITKQNNVHIESNNSKFNFKK